MVPVTSLVIFRHLMFSITFAALRCFTRYILGATTSQAYRFQTCSPRFLNTVLSIRHPCGYLPWLALTRPRAYLEYDVSPLEVLSKYVMAQGKPVGRPAHLINLRVFQCYVGDAMLAKRWHGDIG